MTASNNRIGKVGAPQALDTVALISLGYLMLPMLVFLGGWLAPEFSVICIALLAIHLRTAIPWGKIQWRVRPPFPYLLLILLLAALWTVFGGAGHFFHANADWQVRDGVYGDLILGDWPVSYRLEDGIHRILRSAIGYFFVPAVVAKLIGLQAADMLLWLWTFIGASLFLLLLPVPWRANWQGMALLLVAIGFSGMDALGVVLTAGYWPIFPIRIEWWVPLSYPSITGMIYWGPNHALPLIITTALFFRHWQDADCFQFFITLLVCALIWTPFVVLGLAPFLTLLIIERRRAGLSLKTMAARCVLPAIIAYPIVRFLTLDLFQIAPQLVAAPGGSVTAPARSNFLLEIYAPFLLMEFGILALLLRPQLKHSFTLFWISVSTLAALPFISAGTTNDILLRVSTPPLVILLILTLLALQQPWLTWRDSRILLIMVLLVGVVTPLHEIWRGATWRHNPPDYPACNLVDRLYGSMPAHYFGRLDADDVKMMLREPKLIGPGKFPPPDSRCVREDRSLPRPAPEI